MYPGSPFVLAVFHFCFLALIALIFPRPRLYVYTFLSGLLFLGFWPKVVAHTIWNIDFVEPVGDFSGSAQAWDSALLAASAGAAGIMGVRLLYLYFTRHRCLALAHALQPAPFWFVRYRRLVWLATLGLILLLNVGNFYFAFYQIGVNPKLILPMRLNIPIAWLINVGFAFWLAALVHWELRAGRRTLAISLGGPIFEAFLSSVSALSRLSYLLHTVPYWVALWEKWHELKDSLKSRVAVLVVLFVIFFALSIYAVFWIRANIYYPVPVDESFTSQLNRTIKRQVPDLVLHRWVGLEGVLAVGAVPDRGKDLLFEAVSTDPKLGVKSLYQRIAKVNFHSENPNEFTFLANSGIVAIFLFSGSLAIVFLGLGFITTLLVGTEICIERLLANDFMRAVAGASVANVVAQTTFPYLTAVFFLQLWLAIAFLVALERAGKH